jgi:hypothetical protein
MTNLNLTTTPGAGDNSAGAMDDLKKRLKSLGGMEGKGSACRPQAGRQLAIAAQSGLIDEDYAAEAYAEYAAGIASAASRNPLVHNPGSEKAQVAKFRAFIKAGALPGVDAVDVLNRAEALHAAHVAAGTKVESPFQALYNVCVEQVRQPDEELSDEQINARIMKAEPKDKDDMARLVAAYKAAYKLAETVPMPGTEAAVAAYRDAITEAGGDIPAMTKEEKKEAEALAFLRQRGATIAFAAE